MIDTITRYLTAFNDQMTRRAMQSVIAPIGDRLSSRSVSSAGLVIKAGASPIVKTGATAYHAVCKGRLVTKAASTDMPALVGTVANATFNTFSFFIDGAGTLTTVIGTPGATLNAVVMPAPQPGQAQLGFIIVNPTGTGAFVGGTTALDDATVVPNVVYINTICGFDPTVLV